MSLILDAHLSKIMLSHSTKTVLESIEALVKNEIDAICLLEKNLRGCLMPFHIKSTVIESKTSKNVPITKGRERWDRLVQQMNDPIELYGIELFEIPK